MYAYVLVSLGVPEEEAVLEDFLDLKNVEEGHILFGEWDILLKIKCENAESVAQFVIDKIRSRDEVHLTSTLIVAK